MAAVVLSLISITFFAVAWICLPLFAVVADRLGRMRSRLVASLSPWCDSSELADIDRMLDRVMAEEMGSRDVRHHAA